MTPEQQARRRVSWLRYRHSEKGQAAARRYEQSARGREMKRERNAARIFSCGIYCGTIRFTKREMEEMLGGEERE